MSARDASDLEVVRIRFVLVGMLGALFFLGAMLWNIQIAQASRYQDSIYRQTIRRVRLPGARGRILDRNGRVLADNRPSYCIAIHLNELRMPGGWRNTIDHVESILGRVSELTGLTSSVSRDRIQRHIKETPLLPMLVWREIDATVMARLAERRRSLPGVVFYVEAVRVYPQGEIGAHIMGYARKTAGRPDASEAAERQESYHFYLPEMEGKRGIEKEFNHVLSGRPGGRLVRVDATGFERKLDYDTTVAQERQPLAGDDVHLTIDLQMQRLAEASLEGYDGAVAILDPSNGDVLALASLPAYDPNKFVPSLSPAYWDHLRHHPGKPLHNRAVSGLYPPGSTFKPIVAIAGMANGPVTQATTYDCPGYYALGKTELDCWIRRYNRGHGRIDMIKAFEQSCNTYFCELGNHIGYDSIFHMSKALGLGHLTGIELDGENRGSIPAPRTIRSRGDVANVSIGQGAVAVTPIQMAVATAAIANGGHLYRPRLVKRYGRADGGNPQVFASRKVREMNWPLAIRQTVRKGMLDVVHSDSGTGKRARIARVQMAGKTGTAEYGPKEAGQKRGWMILFAPYDEPRYAVAMVMDDVQSGGISVAPRARWLMHHIFHPGEPMALPPSRKAEEG
jgi:penicillin-binding protein 2